jgi:hypothetical protein
MKKYIILMLSLMMAISMVACRTEPEPEVPDIEPPVIEQENSELIKEIEAAVNDMIGDYIILANYGDGIYSVVVTYDGIEDTIGTEEYNDACISFDEVTIAISEDFGVDCMISIASDKNNDKILYITYNGEDVTNYVG